MIIGLEAQPLVFFVTNLYCLQINHEAHSIDPPLSGLIHSMNEQEGEVKLLRLGEHAMPAAFYFDSGGRRADRLTSVKHRRALLAKMDRSARDELTMFMGFLEITKIYDEFQEDGSSPPPESPFKRIDCARKQFCDDTNVRGRYANEWRCEQVHDMRLTYWRLSAKEVFDRAFSLAESHRATAQTHRLAWQVFKVPHGLSEHHKEPSCREEATQHVKVSGAVQTSFCHYSGRGYGGIRPDRSNGRQGTCTPCKGEGEKGRIHMKQTLQRTSNLLSGLEAGGADASPATSMNNTYLILIPARLRAAPSTLSFTVATHLPRVVANHRLTIVPSQVNHVFRTIAGSAPTAAVLLGRYRRGDVLIGGWQILQFFIKESQDAPNARDLRAGGGDASVVTMFFRHEYISCSLPIKFHSPPEYVPPPASLATIRNMFSTRMVSGYCRGHY
jgi:hypothetical protein